MTTASPNRGAIAGALTLAVLTLLLISFASIGRTSGYSLFRADTNERAAANVTVALQAVGDLSERIRIVLHAVPRGADAHAVPVVGSSAPHQMVPTQKDNAKSIALALSAALFAAFGLVVLWWGKDSASFWLGTSCAALAPELLTLYGFVPEPLMLVCRIVADLLTFLAFYALYAMADAVAREALRSDDRIRTLLGPLRAGVIALLSIGALENAAATLLPVGSGTMLPQSLVAVGSLATTLSWVLVFCALPVLLLTVAALRAASAEQAKRSRVMLVTTVAGLSGIAFSIEQELAGGGAPHFETIWFTLLLIPIGFMIAIRAFGVIEVKVIINRILVLTAMTIIVAAAIALSETIVHGILEEWIKPRSEGEQQAFNAALQFLVAFLVVLLFGNLHHRLEERFHKIVFRRRDRAIAKLKEFALREAPRFSDRRTLLERTAALVREAARTTGVAIYQKAAGAYELAATSGTESWPARVEGEIEGIAFPLAAAGRNFGSLAIAPRAGAAEGPLDGEELEAVESVARALGEALFGLRIGDLVAFVADVADGRADGSAVRSRAAELRATSI